MRGFARSLLALTVVALCQATPACAEVIFNLNKSPLEDSTRQLGEQLLAAIQKLFDAVILVEKRDTQGANGVIKETQSRLQDLVGSYKALDVSKLEGTNLKDVTVFLAKDQADRVISEFEFYQVAIPADLVGLHQVAIDEVTRLENSLHDIQFSPEIDNSTMVVRLYNAMNRVLYLGVAASDLSLAAAPD